MFSVVPSTTLTLANLDMESHQATCEQQHKSLGSSGELLQKLLQVSHSQKEVVS